MTSYYTPHHGGKEGRFDFDVPSLFCSFCCCLFFLFLVGNASAVEVVTHWLHHFRRMRDNDRDPVVLAQRPEKPLLEMCLGE